MNTSYTFNNVIIKKTIDDVYLLYSPDTWGDRWTLEQLLDGTHIDHRWGTYWTTTTWIYKKLKNGIYKCSIRIDFSTNYWGEPEERMIIYKVYPSKKRIKFNKR